MLINSYELSEVNVFDYIYSVDQLLKNAFQPFSSFFYLLLGYFEYVMFFRQRRKFLKLLSEMSHQSLKLAESSFDFPYYMAFHDYFYVVKSNAV